MDYFNKTNYELWSLWSLTGVAALHRRAHIDVGAATHLLHHARAARDQTVGHGLGVGGVTQTERRGLRVHLKAAHVLLILSSSQLFSYIREELKIKT